MIRVKKILSTVLGVDESTITDTMSPDSVESWDSFNGLMLVSELEREFDVSFSVEDISGVTCVGDIYKALRRYGVELQES